jgi:signal transduction histidine kinase
MSKPRFILWILLISIFPKIYGQSIGDSWQQAKTKGEGVLVVAYSENSPFIYINKKGDLVGIEYQILKEFVKFIDEKYQVKLTLMWEHLNKFESLLDTLKQSSRPIIGIASISITDQRKKEFKLSRPYMPDIEIIISSGNIGSLGNLGKFLKMMSVTQAITVSNSTFENNILELKNGYFPNINIQYVPHVDILVDAVAESKNSWGYVSLPNYLSYYRSGKNISRQRFFMVENEGLAIALPTKSDWEIAINTFIEDPSFTPFINKLIDRNLGSRFNNVVGSISNKTSDLQPDVATNREVGVLTLERELQDLKLKQSELEIGKKNLFIYLAIIGIVLALVVLFAVYRLMRLKAKTNESLFEKNKQIKQQNQELNSLNIEKNELIGIVAHDLKNPLTSAMSIAELFSEENVSNDQKEYLSLIQRSLNRMNGLVAKILEIKVLESKSLQINYTVTDLKQIAERVIASLKIQSDNKKIKVHADLDESIRKIDISLLEQILDNLLSNAIKFSNRGSSVFITLKNNENKIQFMIEDEGPGISDEDKSKLFQKFQKLDARPTAGENSTGLGLSIVKKYVEAMNGKVWCESEIQKGAKFIVEFKK